MQEGGTVPVNWSAYLTLL